MVLCTTATTTPTMFARSSLLIRFLSINGHCHPRACPGDPFPKTSSGQGANTVRPLPFTFLYFFLSAYLLLCYKKTIIHHKLYHSLCLRLCRSYYFFRFLLIPIFLFLLIPCLPKIARQNLPHLIMRPKFQPLLPFCPASSGMSRRHRISSCVG